MNADVFQHFRKDEHPFIDLIGDWVATVDRLYAPYLIDFLNPRQRFLLDSLVARESEVAVAYFGGYPEAERQRALLYPMYYEPEESDFQIAAYEIEYPVKFGSISHGDILGSLVGTGIDRSYFGDILTDGAERWQFMLDTGIEQYVTSQLTKIGRYSVRLKALPFTELVQPLDDWEEVFYTVSSLRVDVLVATVFGISRQRAKKLLEADKVQVNWVQVERGDFQVDVRDIISVRGFGRMRIQEIEGLTKKEKIKIQMGILRK